MDKKYVLLKSRVKYLNTSLLVPGDPSRLGTLIYIVTVETLLPVQPRPIRLRSYRKNLNNVLYPFVIGLSGMAN